jgi:hypothetical protein
MKEAPEKKDCDFLQYVEKRDAQIDGIVEKHNQAFRENTDAINQMRAALEARTAYVKEQTNVLSELTGHAGNDPDKQGIGDLLAGCLLSISDGIAPHSFLSDHQLARLANYVISRKSRISRKPRHFEKMPITGIVELCIC